MNINDLMSKHDITRVGDKLRVYPRPDQSTIEFIQANRQDIFRYLAEKEEAERQAREARERKIEGIEGLAIIRAAMADLSAWQYEWEASFDDVGGLGVRPKPQYNFKELHARYPRAAAYLKAEEYASAANYMKAAAGRAAKEEIIDGGDYEAAIQEMEKEWTNYCNERAFD